MIDSTLKDDLKALMGKIGAAVTGEPDTVSETQFRVKHGNEKVTLNLADYGSIGAAANTNMQRLGMSSTRGMEVRSGGHGYDLFDAPVGGNTYTLMVDVQQKGS